MSDPSTVAERDSLVKMPISPTVSRQEIWARGDAVCCFHFHRPGEDQKHLLSREATLYQDFAGLEGMDAENREQDLDFIQCKPV